MNNYLVDIHNPSVLSASPLEHSEICRRISDMHKGTATYSVIYRTDYGKYLKAPVRKNHTLVKLVRKGISKVSDYKELPNYKRALELGWEPGEYKLAGKYREPDENGTSDFDADFHSIKDYIMIPDDSNGPAVNKDGTPKEVMIKLYPSTTFEYDGVYYYDGKEVDKDWLRDNGVMIGSFWTEKPARTAKNSEGVEIIDPDTGKAINIPEWRTIKLSGILDIRGGKVQ